MFRRNHLRKCLFFSLILIILTQCGSLGNSEVIQDTYEVEQHKDVLAKITSDHQVSIYEQDQNERILIQEIEIDSEIRGLFLTGELLVIEEEGYYLTLYRKDRNSFGREYKSIGRIQLHTKQKVEGVEIKDMYLVVIFYDSTEQYDISEKIQRIIKGERILQASSSFPTFSPFTHISSETHRAYKMRLVGDYLLYSGYKSQMKFAKYDGSAFQSVFVSPQASFTEDVQFDLTKKWLFQGQNGSVVIYTPEESGYQPKHFINHTHVELAHFMDLHQEYLLLCYRHHFPLYKWDGSNFNLEHNFTETMPQDFWGLKMCTDKIIIATRFQPVNNIKRAVFKVYNTSNEYKLVQQLFTEETEIKYTLVGTDDCGTVILSPYYEIGGKIYILHRNETGHFVMSNYSSPRDDKPINPCIHPDGDFFVLPRYYGSDLWVKNHESGEYAYHSIIGSRLVNYTSCGINHDLIVLADRNNNTYFSLYNPSQYGNKIDLHLSEPQFLNQASRKVIDISLSGDNLVFSEEYMGSYMYKEQNGSFSLNQTLDHSRFISSVDAENSLQLVVQGGYDQIAYIYKDQSQGLSLVQNISTESQIMAVDLDTNGRLLLGHMNGDISEYSWNLSQFNAENKFPTTGGRIYGVKSCPNEEIVALKEKEGRFHLVLMGTSGDEKHAYQLEELVGVKFAVADDCSKVFISSTMSMQVQVFVLEEGQYSLFKTVKEKFPLYDIAIHPEADMFVVNRHTNHSSAVYRYDQCTKDYEVEEVIEGDSDHYAVEMSEHKIVLGGMDGKVTAYNYTYSLREVCRGFGQKKFTSPISDVTTVTAPRLITNMDVSDDLVVASSLYSGVLLFQIPPPAEQASVATFDHSIFVSSVSIISALKTFAAGTFNNTVLVYIDSGSGYELNQTIQTDSQVTSIDLSENNKLLVGMMNGDLAEYSSDGSSFSSSANTSNTNSQVYAVEVCPGGTKVTVLEAAGVFSLVIFPTDNSEPISFVDELEQELIEPYLSVSQNCQIIAVSGVSAQKVQVFRKETDYKLFKSIEIGSPLSKVSVEEEGDILIVPSIVSPESYVYQYHECTGIYSPIKTLSSGTYDESTAVNSQYILQGNFDGTIKISEYSYIYNATCETKANSIIFRQKSSQNPEARSSEEQHPYKKMMKTDFQSQASLSSEGSTITSAFIFMIIVFGSLIVAIIFVPLTIWRISKRNSKNQQIREKQTLESAKEIQDHQSL